MDVDDIFERVVILLSPIWGPFYALFYIVRLLWHELIRSFRDEEDEDEDDDDEEKK